MDKEQKKDMLCSIIAGISVFAGLTTTDITSAICFGIATTNLCLTQVVIDEDD